MMLMMTIMLVSIIFAYQGVSMQSQVSGKEATFHQLQESYFTISKTQRDTAETGSTLNSQLVEIQKFPSELLRLKLVGVGKIQTGIFILLFGILIALIMMPVRFGDVIKQNSMK